MIFSKLYEIWSKNPQPFYVDKDIELKFDQLKNIEVIGLNKLKKGDVVAIIGDFEPKSIYTLLLLIEKGCIVVPLTKETIKQHEYFLEESKAQYIFHKNILQSEISQFQKPHKLLDQLRNNGNPGLITSHRFPKKVLLVSKSAVFLKNSVIKFIFSTDKANWFFRLKKLLSIIIIKYFRRNY